MLQPLVLLVLGVGLWMVGCGEPANESRPPSKAGALPNLASEGKPDVLVVLSPALDREVLRSEAALASFPQVAWWCANGIRWDAAYVRFEAPELNRTDLLGLGFVGSGNEWITRWNAGGYRFLEGSAAEREAFFAAAGGALEEPSAPAAPGVFLQRVPNPGWEALEAELAEFSSRPEGARPRILVVCALQGAAPDPSLSEARLGIPLIMVLPGGQNGGQNGGLNGGEVRPHVVALPDVAATLLDLCALWPVGEPEDPLGAASFARILLKEPVVWRGFAFAKGAGQALWMRSMRWRLVRSESGEVLSFVEQDANRTVNDRTTPGAEGQLKVMGQHLEAWKLRDVNPTRR